MPVLYRMNKESDKPALIKFWGEQSGWDVINEEEWNHRFVHTPMGGAAFSLALEEETQEIVAQTVFFPTLTNIQGYEAKSYRPFGVVVKESFRINGFLKMQKMLFNMYTLAAKTFSKQGVEVMHMIPDHRWARIISMFPFLQKTTFPLYSLSLPLVKNYQLPENISVSKLDPNDNAINNLWSKASKLYACMQVRDTRTLPWKTSHGDFKVIGVYKYENLIGLCSCIKKQKDGQWLLTDLLSANNEEALHCTLMAAGNWINERVTELPEAERNVIKKIAVLCTPVMEVPLQQLGYTKDNYDFTFVIHILDKNLKKKQVAPKQWYVSAND